MHIIAHFDTNVIRLVQSRTRAAYCDEIQKAYGKELVDDHVFFNCHETTLDRLASDLRYKKFKPVTLAPICDYLWRVEGIPVDFDPLDWFRQEFLKYVGSRIEAYIQDAGEDPYFQVQAIPSFSGYCTAHYTNKDVDAETIDIGKKYELNFIEYDCDGYLFTNEHLSAVIMAYIDDKYALISHTFRIDQSDLEIRTLDRGLSISKNVLSIYDVEKIFDTLKITWGDLRHVASSKAYRSYLDDNFPDVAGFDPTFSRFESVQDTGLAEGKKKTLKDRGKKLFQNDLNHKVYLLDEGFDLLKEFRPLSDKTFKSEIVTTIVETTPEFHPRSTHDLMELESFVSILKANRPPMDEKNHEKEVKEPATMELGRDYAVWQTHKNANAQIRPDPITNKAEVGPWRMSTIDPPQNFKSIEI